MCVPQQLHVQARGLAELARTPQCCSVGLWEQVEGETSGIVMDYGHRAVVRRARGDVVRQLLIRLGPSQRPLHAVPPRDGLLMLFILARTLELLGIGGLVLYRFRKRLRVIHRLGTRQSGEVPGGVTIHSGPEGP